MNQRIKSRRNRTAHIVHSGSAVHSSAVLPQETPLPVRVLEIVPRCKTQRARPLRLALSFFRAFNGQIGGDGRNRTGVRGFAVRCVTTPPRRRRSGPTIRGRPMECARVNPRCLPQPGATHGRPSSTGRSPCANGRASPCASPFGVRQLRYSRDDVI